MFVIPGLVGPKTRRFSVGDGQRVNIPVPVLICCLVRIGQAGADYWLYPSNPPHRRRMKRRDCVEFLPTRCLEKLSNAWLVPTVPKTNTGAQGE